MSWPRGKRALRHWVERCWARSRLGKGIWLVPTGDGRLALLTADGLWAVLTIFEIGQLRDALRQAAFELHQEDVRIDVPLEHESGNVGDGDAVPAVAPKRMFMVIADHGRVQEPHLPDDMRHAS